MFEYDLVRQLYYREGVSRRVASLKDVTEWCGVTSFNEATRASHPTGFPVCAGEAT